MGRSVSRRRLPFAFGFKDSGRRSRRCFVDDFIVNDFLLAPPRDFCHYRMSEREENEGGQTMVKTEKGVLMRKRLLEMVEYLYIKPITEFLRFFLFIFLKINYVTNLVDI